MAMNLSTKQKAKVLKSYLGSWFYLLSGAEIRTLGSLPRDTDMVIRVATMEDVKRFVTYLLLRDPGRKDYRVLHLFEVIEIQFQRSRLYESLADIQVPWFFCIVNFHQLRNNMANEVLFQTAVVRQNKRKNRTVVFLFDDDEEVLKKAESIGYHVVRDLRIEPAAEPKSVQKKKRTKRSISDDGKGGEV